MTDYSIMISAPYLQKDFKTYKAEFDRRGIDCYLPPVIERMSEEQLVNAIHRFDGVICGDDPFNRRVIDLAKKLKVIVKWGTGIDSIDNVYAESKNIPVCNTPGAFTQPVSDSVMAYVLAFSRGIVLSHRLMAEGKWEKPRGFSAGELTLGIIGVGRIGKEVARKAAPFGLELLGNDIHQVDDDVYKGLGIKMVDLAYLLEKSNIVSINCDLNPTSYHLLNYDKFRLMKPGAILINTARGPIIKENDMIRALSGGCFGGAALDVFETEPLPVESPLRKMNNVMLSAHNTNNSPHYWKKVHENSINMLFEKLGLGPLEVRIAGVMRRMGNGG